MSFVRRCKIKKLNESSDLQAYFCQISLLGCYCTRKKTRTTKFNLGISVSKVLVLLKLCAMYIGFNFDLLDLDCCNL